MAEKITKNISLTSHLDQFIEGKVRSGRYQSASEVVREGLRLMEEREAALANVRGAIDEGWGQSEQGEGEGRDGEPIMKEMRQVLVKKLKARKKARAMSRSKA